VVSFPIHTCTVLCHCWCADVYSLITVLCHAAGIIFATFVGVVATTLSLASIGLVAVASGAGTTAAAGGLLFASSYESSHESVLTLTNSSTGMTSAFVCLPDDAMTFNHAMQCHVLCAYVCCFIA